MHQILLFVKYPPAKKQVLLYPSKTSASLSHFFPRFPPFQFYFNFLFYDYNLLNSITLKCCCKHEFSFFFLLLNNAFIHFVSGPFELVDGLLDTRKRAF